MSELAANAPRFLVTINSVELLVSEFEAVEEISNLYTIDLKLASEDDIDLDDMVGKSAIFKILGDPEDRFFHGIVCEFKLTETKRRFFTYQARIVPQIYLLSLRKDCRIFQDMNVPDIVARILDDAGIPGDSYAFRLQSTYEPREYCVQYREKELDFISRLLEEEGIFYFFEHTEEKTTLVFGDGTVNYVPIPGEKELEFHPEAGMAAEVPYVYAFEKTRQIHSGKIILRDSNFLKPAVDLTCKQEGSGDNTRLSVFDYPGVYAEKDKGGTLAQVRLQEAAVFKDKLEGKSTCARFTCGHTFDLTEHDRDALNASYLLVSVNHKGCQPGVLGEQAGTDVEEGYNNEFTAIPVETIFRPRQKTPKARVDGLQTAEVVGPEGEDIHCDEHGRVKVWFRWDHAEEDIDKRSCWIRVCQNMAGTNWGHIWLPRVGHEVVVDFLEGNPDRPLIIGQVYNAANPPPYGLPDEKTKSTIKTSTSKGEGFNEIRFEDKSGHEQIFVHAQKSYDKVVKASCRESIGGSHHLTVKKKKLTKIEEDMHLSVKGSLKEKVDGSLSTIVGSNLYEKVGINHALESGSEIHLKAGMKVVIESGLSLTLKSSGGFITIDPGGIWIQGTLVQINSGGAAQVGCGSQPESPDEPDAASGDPGRRAAPPAPQVVQRDQTQTQDPQTLQVASNDGVPFCASCEAQRQSQTQSSGTGGNQEGGGGGAGGEEQ